MLQRQSRPARCTFRSRGKQFFYSQMPWIMDPSSPEWAEQRPEATITLSKTPEDGQFPRNQHIRFLYPIEKRNLKPDCAPRKSEYRLARVSAAFLPFFRSHQGKAYFLKFPKVRSSRPTHRLIAF